ncbi:hypothetical protein [Coleofasciculus sp. F4-SAH-05]|uniref:hypothetical protein n=1 Tax=Coleofasciculus sp. F4-SAH-05 TaxID=3069525 RepID=UPI003300A3DA
MLIYILSFAMTLCFISVYTLISLYLSAAWFRFFTPGIKLSNQQKVFSFLTIGIATVCWPLVLPIAYVKLLNASASKF